MRDRPSVEGSGRGTVVVQIVVQEKPTVCSLIIVLFEPLLSNYLLSFSVMARAEPKAVFENKLCSVIQN